MSGANIPLNIKQREIENDRKLDQLGTRQEMEQLEADLRPAVFRNRFMMMMMNLTLIYNQVDLI